MLYGVHPWQASSDRHSPNSSSMAIMISTWSKLSRPRSFMKWDDVCSCGAESNILHNHWHFSFLATHSLVLNRHDLNMNNGYSKQTTVKYSHNYYISFSGITFLQHRVKQAFPSSASHINQRKSHERIKSLLRQVHKVECARTLTWCLTNCRLNKSVCRRISSAK